MTQNLTRRLFDKWVRLPTSGSPNSSLSHISQHIAGHPTTISRYQLWITCVHALNSELRSSAYFPLGFFTRVPMLHPNERYTLMKTSHTRNQIKGFNTKCSTGCLERDQARYQGGKETGILGVPIVALFTCFGLAVKECSPV